MRVKAKQAQAGESGDRTRGGQEPVRSGCGSGSGKDRT